MRPDLIMLSISGYGLMDATFATDDRTHFELEDSPDTLPISPIFDLPFARVYLATDMKLLFRRLNRREGMVDLTPEDADLSTKVRLREETDQLIRAQTVRTADGAEEER